MVPILDQALMQARQLALASPPLKTAKGKDGKREYTYAPASEKIRVGRDVLPKVGLLLRVRSERVEGNQHCLVLVRSWQLTSTACGDETELTTSTPLPYDVAPSLGVQWARTRALASALTDLLWLEGEDVPEEETHVPEPDGHAGATLEEASAPPRQPKATDASVTLEFIEQAIKCRSIAHGQPVIDDRVEIGVDDVRRARWPDSSWLAYRFSHRASQAAGGEARFKALNAWPSLSTDETPSARELVAGALPHRDLKPSNIIKLQRGEEETPRANDPEAALLEPNPTGAAPLAATGVDDGARDQPPHQGVPGDGEAGEGGRGAVGQGPAAGPHGDAPGDGAAVRQGVGQPAPAHGLTEQAAGAVSIPPSTAPAPAAPSPKCDACGKVLVDDGDDGLWCPDEECRTKGWDGDEGQDDLLDAEEEWSERPAWKVVPLSPGPGGQLIHSQHPDGRVSAQLPVAEPTLNEALAARGYSTRPAARMAGTLGKKDILRADGTVAAEALTAGDAWKWLRAQAKPEDPGPSAALERRGEFMAVGARVLGDKSRAPSETLRAVAEIIGPEGQAALARAFPTPEEAAPWRELAERWKNRPKHRAKTYALGPCAACGIELKPLDLYFDGTRKPPGVADAQRLSPRGVPYGRAHAECVDVMALGRDPRHAEAS